MKYDALDLKINRLSCKIRTKFQNSLQILLILIYQAFVPHKYSQNYPAVSSINNVSFKGGGGLSHKLTLGSQMATIRLLMNSP